MSRTDKDVPMHIEVTWWRPWHVSTDEATCEHAHANYSTGPGGRPNRACDLPAAPVVGRYSEEFHRGGCWWTPVHVRAHYPNPDHGAINLVWTSSERAAARVDCRNALKEYRGSGDVETLPTVRQNRYCSTKKWPWY